MLTRAACLLALLLSIPLGVAGASVNCPASFTCGFTAVLTKGLTGASDDGQPSTLVGTLSFDGMTNPTMTAELNQNGQSFKSQILSGTCADDSTGLGVLDFTAGGGPRLHFVVTNSGSKLRLINEPTAGDSSVVVGTCTR